MSTSQLLSVLMILLATIVSLVSYYYSKRNQFYSDSFWLLPLGIFIWGDGLILGPFWLFSGFLFWFLPPVMIVRYVLLFFMIRGGYEVVYWIGHQMAKKDYRPPLFRRITWLGSQESAILYQLLTMCQTILAAFGLLLTY